MTRPRAVIFDVGGVLFQWSPRFLYERLIEDGRALDAFLATVLTREWHFQHDCGRPFAETSAELIAQFPEHADLISVWQERFNETIPGPVPGTVEILEELDAAGVPLFCITNFSGEFWGPFRDREAAVFDRFRDIIVSGTERLIKPDPAIYALALERFGLAPGEAVFIDDVPANAEAATRAGIRGIHFTGAEALRAELAGLGLLD
ncbi:HAD family phosphatase [Sphingomonas sp. LB-2]|uniref:HAD family hydrolase n=1 Tax=Sphingomonas caeni TaxID=2984949 RepID=UPI002230C110|nr:HAD family phosphatase [Sphingomonas caeni]MCW3846250.1 HAD family phosphatase [Sphingomonas caeni]